MCTKTQGEVFALRCLSSQAGQQRTNIFDFGVVLELVALEDETLSIHCDVTGLSSASLQLHHAGLHADHEIFSVMLMWVLRAYHASRAKSGSLDSSACLSRKLTSASMETGCALPLSSFTLTVIDGIATATGRGVVPACLKCDTEGRNERL